MGLHIGGIFVRATDTATQSSVTDFIRGHWLGLGATLSSEDPLSFAPLRLEHDGRLAFVVTPPEPDDARRDHWVAIYDSERYSADPGLAHRLAAHFGTDAWLFEVTDSVNQAYAKRYGASDQVIRGSDAVEALVASMPYPFLYFNKLREEVPPAELAKFQSLAFEGVPYRPGARYSGPSPKQLDSNAKTKIARELAAVLDARGLLRLADDHQVLYDVIAPTIDRADLKDAAALAFVHLLAPIVLEQSNVHCREEIAEAALRAGDEALFERAMTPLAAYKAALFEARAVKIGLAGEPLIAFRLLEAITRSPGSNLTSWTNALYFFLTVHANPGVSPERAEALLEGARKRGPTNSFIFHNLACAYMKLGRREDALGAVEDAVKYGYAQLDKLRADDVLPPLHADLRFSAAFDKPVGVTSIDHLRVERSGHTLIVPAIGLHLYFAGGPNAEGTRAIAGVLAALHAELPAMFSHYRERGAAEATPLKPSKKGKLTRDLNVLRKGTLEPRVQMLFASVAADASDLRVELSLDAERAGYLLVHFPLSLASDPDALFERFVEIAKVLPFTSGHAGLTLATSGGSHAEGEIVRIAADYFGLSLAPTQLGRTLREHRAAPGWLTFLGRSFASRLPDGALAAVAQSLPDGALVIRAARRPFVGVRSAPVDLGALPQVVRALQGILTDDERKALTPFDAKREEEVAALAGC